MIKPIILTFIIALLTVGQTVGQEALTLVNWQNSILEFAQHHATRNANLADRSQRVQIGIGPKGAEELASFIKMSKDAYQRTGNINDLRIKAAIQTTYPDLYNSFNAHTEAAQIAQGSKAILQSYEISIPPNQ